MRLRAPLVLGLLLSAAWIPLPASAQRAPWPVAGRTPAHAAVTEGPAPPYRVVWETELEDGPPAAAPVLGEAMLVVLGRSEVAALDPESGDELWSVERAEGTGGAPAVAGDLVLFVEGDGEEAALVAVGAPDGEEEWRTEIEGHAPGGVVVAEGRAYVASRRGTVYAVDLDGGSVAWTFPENPAGRRFESAPAVAGDLLLVTGQITGERTSFLQALDRETGEPAWGFRPEGIGLGISSPSEEGGLVLAGTVDGRPRASAFDLAGGGSEWTTDIRFPFAGRQMPIVADSDVVIADAAGHLYRLDRSDGELRWTYRVPGFLIGGSPSIAGGSVVVGDLSGQVSAIDLESGLLVWRRSFGDDQVHPIASDGDRLYVAARGGTVAALEHDPDGSLLEEPSPTTLFLDRALLNFGAAFAIVGGALALLSLLWRRRGG
ncbi:MAG TPA: PQQ-binding-like beta-propeller repeat protein [Actinomycetota bacterium]